MAEFSDDERRTLLTSLYTLRRSFEQNLAQPVRDVCTVIPEDIENVNRQITGAEEHLRQSLLYPGSVELHNSYLPVYKKAVIVGRQATANSIEVRTRDIVNDAIKVTLQQELAPYDRLIGQDWFQSTHSMSVPRLIDFLSLRRAAEYLPQQSVPSARVYDEKFGILRAPDLFLMDLRYFRLHCDLRGTSVAAAFIDIDDFKKRFNSSYGNERIDREVLPRFMETIESHVFGRGYGYRQGGDEYLVLLPSVSSEEAIRILEILRQKVAALEYLGIPEHTEVSIGLCHVEHGCFLTDREVREKANEASAYAKGTPDNPKKNCIATYKGDLYKPQDLYIAAPS